VGDSREVRASVAHKSAFAKAGAAFWRWFLGAHGDGPAGAERCGGVRQSFEGSFRLN